MSSAMGVGEATDAEVLAHFPKAVSGGRQRGCYRFITRGHDKNGGGGNGYRAMCAQTELDVDAIAAFDLEGVLASGEGWRLRDVLDSVAFGKLPGDDDSRVQGAYARNLLKTLRVGQVIIEYLLGTQEVLVEEREKAASDAIEWQRASRKLKKKVHSLSTQSPVHVGTSKAPAGTEESEGYAVATSVGGQILSCPYCPKYFVSASYLSAHIERRHGQKENRAEGANAEAVYDDVSSAAKPVQAEHNNAVVDALKAETRSLRDELQATRALLEESKRERAVLAASCDTIAGDLAAATVELSEKRKCELKAHQSREDKAVSTARQDRAEEDTMEMNSLRHLLKEKSRQTAKAEEEIVNVTSTLESLLEGYQSLTRSQLHSRSILESILRMRHAEPADGENDVDVRTKNDALQQSFASVYDSAEDAEQTHGVDSPVSLVHEGPEDDEVVEEIDEYGEDSFEEEEEEEATEATEATRSIPITSVESEASEGRQEEEDGGAIDSGPVLVAVAPPGEHDVFDQQNAVEARQQLSTDDDDRFTTGSGKNYDSNDDDGDGDNDSLEELSLAEGPEQGAATGDDADRRPKEASFRPSPSKNSRGWTNAELDYIDNVYASECGIDVVDAFEDDDRDAFTQNDSREDDEGVSAILHDSISSFDDSAVVAGSSEGYINGFDERHADDRGVVGGGPGQQHGGVAAFNLSEFIVE